MRREFTAKTKLAAWDRAGGCCEHCTLKVTAAIGPTQYDHRIPDGLGGEPTLENCQVLCKPCHDLKTHTSIDGDVSKIAKAKRINKRQANADSRRLPAMPGSRRSPWKRKINGTLERRS